MDKACRHAAQESLSTLFSLALKQRSIFMSTMSLLVSKSLKLEFAAAPLSSFEVVPASLILEGKRRFDSDLQNKALIAAVMAGANRGKTWSQKKRGSFAKRGTRGAFSGRRGGTQDRTSKGGRRGTWQKKRGFNLSKKNKDSFMRRDKAVRQDRGQEATASTSAQNQL